ncbi:N-acetylmuramic acid 6-phosphate etherase [Vibrio stylophorae]|nr:N-acetylmuramic acid 6-phosphate etherase [Vibrio stylophorae]
MPESLKTLLTESQNPVSRHIDTLATRDMLAIINQQDALVSQAIAHELDAIAQAVDIIAAAFHRGGRLFYIGAGTSGRLGVLDASECPPTFGSDPNQVIGIIAGGEHALRHAVENAEDDRDQGVIDLQKHHLCDRDVVVGIAASGRTPYVLGALSYAKQCGATTVSVSCNPSSPMTELADIAITPVVGPEVITGSSRMKAGTAQKLVLNMLTTGAMIRTGKVYGNLMVDVQATNAKLHNRQRRIVMAATECDGETAERALAEANNHCKTAIVMVLTGLSADRARLALDEHHGFIRPLIEPN